MIIKRIFFLCSILLAFSFSSLSAQPITGDFYKVKLDKVVDGDTIKVNLACKYSLFCKAVSVRVAGVDTPELKSKDPAQKAKAQEAKQFTINFLTGRKISLKSCVRGKYFRLVCDVYADDENLAQALLANELATPYDGGTKPQG